MEKIKAFASVESLIFVALIAVTLLGTMYLAMLYNQYNMKGADSFSVYQTFTMLTSILICMGVLINSLFLHRINDSLSKPKK